MRRMRGFVLVATLLWVMASAGVANAAVPDQTAFNATPDGDITFSPNPAACGQLVTFFVTYHNAGHATWDRSVIGVYLIPPTGPLGFGFLPNADEVPSGDDVTLHGEFNAPSTPGTYDYATRMDFLNKGTFGSRATGTLVVNCGGVANNLAINQGPTDTTAGSDIAPPITINIDDVLHNLVTSATNSVSVQLNETNGAVLSGTTIESATGGVATFSDLKVNLPGTYSLTFSSPGLTGVTSNSFTITGATPTSCSAGGSLGPTCSATAPGTSGSIVMTGTGSYVVTDATTGTSLVSGTGPAVGVTFVTIPGHTIELSAGPTIATITLS